MTSKLVNLNELCFELVCERHTLPNQVFCWLYYILQLLQMIPNVFINPAKFVFSPGGQYEPLWEIVDFMIFVGIEDQTKCVA